MRRWVAALALLLAAAAPAPAQDPGPDPVPLALPAPDELQILLLESGSQLVGRIAAIGESTVRFVTGGLEIEVARSEIRELRVVSADAVRGGVWWFPDPNETRLFLAPTARPLKQGAGYLADHLLFFPGFQYGLTDNLSLGGGMSLFPGVSLDEQIAFITPKFGWSVNERLDAAVGAAFVALPGEGDASRAGIVYSAGTWSSPDSSLTVGAGYGWTDEGLADRPMLMAGGQRRLTRRIGVVTENWIFPGLEGVLVSAGVRFLGERMSVDLGLAHLLGEEGAFLPVLSFVYAFGER